MKRRDTKFLHRFRLRRKYLIGIGCMFGVAGAAALVWSFAAVGPSVASEVERGTLGAGANVVEATGASDGKAVQFAATAGCGPACGKTVIWSDEFNDTALDAAKWTARDNSNYGTGNNEDQCYYARNVTESGGTLKLTAKRETVTCGGTNPDTGNSTYRFTSGYILSKTNFKQGYYEASIKMPKGTPYWGAFWLTGGTGAPGWPAYGEIDIVELLGVRPDTAYGTYHWACTGVSHCQSSPATFNMLTKTTTGGSADTANQLSPANFSSYSGVSSTRFVTYGVLWEASKITWYVDGQKVRCFDGTQMVRYSASGTPTVEKTYGSGWYDGNTANPGLSTTSTYNHIINLNLALGGNMPTYWGYTGKESSSGYSDGNYAATMPESMEIDYVRVYQ